MLVRNLPQIIYINFLQIVGNWNTFSRMPIKIILKKSLGSVYLLGLRTGNLLLRTNGNSALVWRADDLLWCI